MKRHSLSTLVIKEPMNTLGELYLKLKQPEKAKEHLAKLDSICFFGCEEFDELKEAIQDYEKNN